MTLKELDNYFNSFLKKENYANDIAINGIQIENSDPDKKEIKKIAFAVDACEATEKIAAELNLTLRSVENYLSRIYGKTGCRGHEELIKKFG